MTITLPELSLVLLVGPSGSGKSTFARTHFKPTETISSDYCRALVCDDENDMTATVEAFDLLRTIAGKRLRRGLLTVIDATNVQPEARKPLIDLAREYHVLPVAIVLDLPEEVCHERNRARPDRSFGPHVVRNQRRQLTRTFKKLEREGLRRVFKLTSAEEIAGVTIEREPLWNNRKGEHGPFDIIGDVHGCCDELEDLLERLGYGWSERTPEPHVRYRRVYSHPEGRRALFLGDIVDRGPRILDSFELVRNMTEAGHALCVPGNHDIKLMRKLRGGNVRVAHGLEQSVAEIEGLPEEIREAYTLAVVKYMDALVSHYVLDGGKLVVAHAGMKESMQGRGSRAVRDFALYGQTTGETDEFGLPVRYDWAAEYRGDAAVVYGHTPVPRPEWLNDTINIDTGCVFGGSLTALRYPERELVSVPARAIHAEPIRPIVTPEASLSAQQEHDELLDIIDVTGKRTIDTRLAGRVTIREEESIAALEVMSRFAADPRWLIYLPPTMSPAATSTEPGMLEHPAEVFEYFRSKGVPRVVCEEKHMGSRAVMIICRDEDAAERRFGVRGGNAGVCLTRTGRMFFDDPATEGELLGRLRGALSRAGFWEEFVTDWVALDCELMPWSAKAQELLQRQYAAVGTAARVGLDETMRALELASAGGAEVEALMEDFGERRAMAAMFTEAYRRYCWSVTSVEDLRLAPFHILATEGKVHTDRDHVWHMETIARLVEMGGSGTLQRTASMVVDLEDEGSVAEGIAWWKEMTGRGGEGMVVKPMEFITHSGREIVQPAVKCRGAEYLRIIYGPEYSTPAHLKQLRSRSLALKRALAIREFALGVEGLERFVRREPLRRVHECVFGVLALESEPVDPRL